MSFLPIWKIFSPRRVHCLCFSFFVISILVLSVLLPTSFALAASVSEAIVKIYTVRNTPNYFNPWSVHGPSYSTGSGCIIEGGRILTNGHVVSDQTFVQVRKYGDSKRYRARVLYTSHASDLALLTVDDPRFFKGVKPLKIGSLPNPRREVLVYGFPLGGDTLSITKGVISRIEHQVYAHSSAKLLAGQIDAAINPGNSGGPVVVNGRVVGVVMQAIPSAENIGYMVPSPVIRHFLEDIEDGSYDGFPSAGIVLEPMESESLRRKYGMREGDSGVLVIRVLDGSPADGVLRVGDVILEADGVDVANDGTVEFRAKERTSISYIVQRHQIGEDLRLKILRDGRVEEVVLTLSRPFWRDWLIPQEQYDRLPAYYIYGGLVISPLTKNYLKAWGQNWYNAAPKELVARLANNYPSKDGEQVLLVIKVLASDVNQGYHNLSNWVIKEVNGKEVLNMKELVSAVEEGEEPFVVFTGEDGRMIVLDRREVEESGDTILERYRIKDDRSQDLR